jgi:hypothetical protein
MKALTATAYGPKTGAAAGNIEAIIHPIDELVADDLRGRFMRGVFFR